MFHVIFRLFQIIMYEAFTTLNVHVIVLFYSEYMYNLSTYSYSDNKNSLFSRPAMCLKGLSYLPVITIILTLGTFILSYILAVLKKDVNAYFPYIR